MVLFRHTQFNQVGLRYDHECRRACQFYSAKQSVFSGGECVCSLSFRCFGRGDCILRREGFRRFGGFAFRRAGVQDAQGKGFNTPSGCRRACHSGFGQGSPGRTSRRRERFRALRQIAGKLSAVLVQAAGEGPSVAVSCLHFNRGGHTCISTRVTSSAISRPP